MNNKNKNVEFNDFDAIRKNSQKGFIVPLVIGIIALFIIGGGAYIYSNKKAEAPVVVDSNSLATTTNQTSTTTDATKDWKTYTNTQYGFSFKYPTSRGELTTLKDNSIAIGKNGNTTLVIHMPRIILNNNGQPSTLSDVINNCYPNKGDTCTNVTVGGTKSFERSSSQIGTIVYVPFSNNQIFEIAGSINDPIFDQIISTFKFFPTSAKIIDWDKSKSQNTVFITVYPYPQGKEVFSDTIPNTGSYTLDTTKFWQNNYDGQYEVNVFDKIGGQSLYQLIIDQNQ